MQYIFILGRNSKLSIAEILAVLPQAKVIRQASQFLLVENQDFDCSTVMQQLGGTIKIGVIMADEVSKDLIVKDILDRKPRGKVKFGISYYNSKLKIQNLKFKIQKLGLEVKRLLKEKGVNSRLVTSRDSVLSSVVVAKNKCQEYLILDNEWLAKTCAVQEFEKYSFRDYGRPARDVLSGTMPPKLAKIMINLAQLKSDAKILDPFCGSGTILQEALLLDYKNVTGCDVSEKAVADTQKNINWLITHYPLPITNYQVFPCDVKKLSTQVKAESIDAIITEPYLGPPLKGGESEKQLQQIIDELSKLYLAAFGEFKKILKAGGKVVIIFPRFVYKKEVLKIRIIDKIEELGFKKINTEELVYRRPGQKVEREVVVFTKT